MSAATVTTEMCESTQRQIASHNEQLRIANLQLANASNEVDALNAEVAKIGPLELPVAMLEDLQKETKSKLDLATELLAKAGDKKLETLIDDKHKSRPTFDGTDAKKFVLWNFKFKDFVRGKFPHAENVLDGAKIQGNKIGPIEAEAKIEEIQGLGSAGWLVGFRNTLDD